LKQFVLDASVSLAWFLDSPVPDLAIRVRRGLESGSRAVVPPLWHLEVANGFAVAERRGDLTASFADRCLDDIEGLMASVIDESAEAISLRQAHSVARQFRLTAYDAAYLDTARRERLALATLDRALGEAAAKAGVPLFR
jgi:predicted nucleic acid-binding protein